jgi:hypothetical protein
MDGSFLSRQSCPDGVVQINEQDLSRHDKTVQTASKKEGTSASAGSPIDFVSVAGSVKVPQDLIS